jgi:mRNA-degrading endonuclease RelE of RelBE toxin-antitoxin system
VVPEVADNAVRELFVKNYRLIYEVRSDLVVVLTFVHGARLLPALP